MLIVKLLAAVIAILLLYILFLLICSLFVSTKKEYEEHSTFYRFLLNGASAAALRICRIRIHTEGLDQIPQNSCRLLFVGNHRSNFDPIVTWHVFQKYRPAFVSKPENFNIPIFGRFIRKCCFLPIDRQNPANALKTINRAAGLLAKEEVSIGIYPEGTRSKTGELLPFHNGVFKIAQKADASIVVLAIQGTEKIHKNTPLHATDVYLKVLSVIPAEQIRGVRTAEIGARVRGLLEDAL